MKSATILCLPVLAAAAAIGEGKNVFETRQTEAGTAAARAMFGEQQAPYSIKKLTPILDPKAVREEVLWGPFSLLSKDAKRPWNPTKMDRSSDVFNYAISGYCTDCMVLAAQANIANVSGIPQNVGTGGVYTHHIIMQDFNRKAIRNPVATKCGKYLIDGNAPTPVDVSVFLGKGDEFEGKVFKAKSDTIKTGFYIQKKDFMTFVSEVVNYDTFQKNVFLRLEYEYLPGRPEGYLDIGMGAVNGESCDSGRNPLTYRPPVDRAVVLKGAENVVTLNGYLVNVTPHLHDGGLNVQLFLNGKLVCTSPAVYGGDGGIDVGGAKWETITSYESCMEPIRIVKGDILYMTSEYDLTKHKLRPHSTDAAMGAEIMAVASFFFAQDLKQD